MKQKKTSKKNKKVNIPLRRKVAILYYRFVTCVKILLAIFFYLFFFTKHLVFIKTEIAQSFYDLSSEVGFRLENVLIEGQVNIPSDYVVTQLEADKNTAIFAINLNNVKSNLKKNPWIKEISIARRIPNTIYISIVERTPIAIWQLNKKLFLIDREGVKITGADLDIEKFSYLPHVVGSDANIYAGQLIDDISKYPVLAAKILSFVRYGERRWNLNLEQNITVKMPENGFVEALNYLVELDKASKLFNKNYRVIDLRDKDKYYIEKF
jgi:cell division protein FtsQ